MVYWQNERTTEPPRDSGEPGYAVYDNGTVRMPDEPRYAIYTDDGRGNGDYVCGTDDEYWARRIAECLDAEWSRAVHEVEWR